MDIAFFMGWVTGILTGLGFSIIICKHVKNSVRDGMIEAYTSPKKKNKDILSNEDDDPADWWKKQ